MSLANIIATFAAEGNKGDRAVFEAAMIERIKNEGYSMSDLIYEVYQCQVQISQIKAILEDGSGKSKKK